MLAVGSGQWVKSVLSAESRVLSEESENSWQLARKIRVEGSFFYLVYADCRLLSAEC